MSFERKKIQTETLGEYLTGVRDSLGLSINEVSEKTGIKPKFLSSLENGEFSNLPADVYVLGFLSQLGRMYSVDGEELIGQYKKEKGIHKNLLKGKSFSSKILGRKIFGNLIITPKILSLTLGLAFVAISFGYIVWQVWSINRAPSLEIISPANFSVIAGAAVEILGKTDPGMSVVINGQNIFVDNQGDFKTQLGLTPGPKEIAISAKNRFGKTVNKTLIITGTSQAVRQELGLELRINFTNTVELTIIIDEQPPQNIVFSAGDSKIFSATDKLILSTSNAGATEVNVNGENLGPLGKEGERLDNIPFLASFRPEK